MKTPIEVRATEPSASVSADVDESGSIVGIEILFAADASIVTVARDYAHANGLAFPIDFSGVVAFG